MNRTTASQERAGARSSPQRQGMVAWCSCPPDAAPDTLLVIDPPEINGDLEGFLNLLAQIVARIAREQALEGQRVTEPNAE